MNIGSIATIIGALIIAVAIYASAPSYKIVAINEKVNNGVAAWRINTQNGTVSVCTGTEKGLLCSKDAIETKDQEAKKEE